MDIDYRVKKVEDLRILKSKLSLIRFFGFKLKPYSLGIVCRYVYYRKFKDTHYLEVNELELKTFLDYILDNNLLAEAHLQNKNKSLLNIANQILKKENTEIVVEEREWQLINLFLDYIDSDNEVNLNVIKPLHEKGEIICNYLKFIKTHSSESKVYLEDCSLYSLAFAEGLMYCNQMALDCLLIKDRKHGL